MKYEIHQRTILIFSLFSFLCIFCFACLRPVSHNGPFLIGLRFSETFITHQLNMKSYEVYFQLNATFLPICLTVIIGHHYIWNIALLVNLCLLQKFHFMDAKNDNVFNPLNLPLSFYRTNWNVTPIVVNLWIFFHTWPWLL